MRLALGLGASLGPRRATLERTVMALDAHPGLRVARLSRWYRSPPMRGGTANGWFLNGVVVIDSALPPHEVLAFCRSLEDRAGRRRARHWADRPLDLDLLLAEGFTSDDPTLTVPHPGILARPFVHVPLLEAWPEAEAMLPPGARSDGAVVPVGVFARNGRPTYPRPPLRDGAPREAVHRLGEPRPHP